jgi:hypothetical protein
MFDRTTLKGPIGPPLPRHQASLSKVTYSRFLHAKTKSTTTYVNTPITGAQAEVKYWIEVVDSTSTAMAEISIPLASATVGHNYLHAGLGSITWEIRSLSLLIKVILAVLGFTLAEIARFMTEVICVQLELTWHSRTASIRALHNAQNRSKEHFGNQLLASRLHDISVCSIDYREGDLKAGILVTLKQGDLLRQYGKAVQIASRSKKDRKQTRMSPSSREDSAQIIIAIKTDLRSEILAVGDTLRRLGIERPSSWTEDSLKRVVAEVWKAAGLAPIQPQVKGKLSPTVSSTWARYLAGEDVSKTLSGPTFSRHRAAIKKALGDDKDIAMPRKARGVRSAGLGYQLSYDRRAEPSGDQRRAVLCEVTGPAIVEDLDRGLSFILSGTVPPIDDPAERARWLNRWSDFAQREGGRCHDAE